MSRGRNYMNTPADIRTRIRYIEEVGTLLDQMVNEEIVSLKDIENEFPITYDTIRKLRKLIIQLLLKLSERPVTS